MTSAVTYDSLTGVQTERAWRPADYPPLATSLSGIDDGEATRNGRSVSTLQQQRAALAGQATQTPPCEDTSSDDPFIEALREDSNREMDWLWLATRLSSTLQRRYALERALQINPRSSAAKRGLKQLRRRPDQPLILN